MCGFQNWIGGWGICELWKNNVLILLISSQKLYFVDDDAIYDVIIQEPVWKWRHNYRYEFSRDPFAESVLFQTYSTIFIFRQIDWANFALRCPTSLYVYCLELLFRWAIRPMGLLFLKDMVEINLLKCVYQCVMYLCIISSTSMLHIYDLF